MLGLPLSTGSLMGDIGVSQVMTGGEEVHGVRDPWGPTS